jgi:hypothetical protein
VTNKPTNGQQHDCDVTASNWVAATTYAGLVVFALTVVALVVTVVAAVVQRRGRTQRSDLPG